MVTPGFFWWDPRLNRTKTVLRSQHYHLPIRMYGFMQNPWYNCVLFFIVDTEDRGSPPLSHQEQEQQLLYFDTSMSRNYVV